MLRKRVKLRADMFRITNPSEEVLHQKAVTELIA